MQLNDYQHQTAVTARYPGQGTFIGLAYVMLGLNGEAGESAEKVKKLWRDESADIEAKVVEVFEGVMRWAIATQPRPTAASVREQARKDIHEAFAIQISDERREAIRNELGDTLWYLARGASEIGTTLEEIAQSNIDKLADRRRRDAIHGEGDDR